MSYFDDNDVKVQFMWATVVVLCLFAIVFGCFKGCELSDSHSTITHGQTSAVELACLNQGFTPLECTNALGK